MIDNLVQRGSVAVFCAWVLTVIVNLIGFPASYKIKPDEIQFERPGSVYMLRDTPKKLVGLPLLLEVTPDALLSEKSSLRISENGTPLPHPFAAYRDMIEKGGGYYYYRPMRLSFTTTDNSDPRINGRSYVAVYRLGISWNVQVALLLIFIALRLIVALRLQQPAKLA